MSDERPDPHAIVASKCIAFSEAILASRNLPTNADAARFGQELFNWFRGVGAVTAENAVIAARSVDLGVSMLKTSQETAGEIVQAIQENYQFYTVR